MEVHAHSHTPRKKWTHYFWEFLMLFLAVFCGFLAEYQLEHMIEHQREKQYIKSLVADLESDQQVISRHVIHLEKGISMMDSAVLILNNPELLETHRGTLYYLARVGPRLTPLSTNSRTFDQLKNSGNFRLIRDLTISNKIMSYYEKFPLIRLLESVNETEFNEYKKLAAKIFEPTVFIRMDSQHDGVSRTTENPPLRTTEGELLKELSVFAVYMHGTKKGILSVDRDLKTAGAELLEFLKTSYHLD